MRAICQYRDFSTPIGMVTPCDKKAVACWSAVIYNGLSIYVCKKHLKVLLADNHKYVTTQFGFDPDAVAKAAHKAVR